MVRHPGCMPFVMTKRDWSDLYPWYGDGLDKAADEHRKAEQR